MKIVAIIGFVCLLFLISSCGLSNREKESEIDIRAHMAKDLDKNYQDYKSQFDPEMINHFPDKVNTNTIMVNYSNSNSNDLVRLEITNRIINENLDSLIKEYLKSNIARYSANDTFLLIPQRHINKENILKTSRLNIDSLSKFNLNNYAKSKIPVPSFWKNEFFNNETECKLPKDFSIFVLDAKSGKFLADSLIAPNKLMPNNWVNGYSKGVAISKEKEVIIYWLIIW